MQLVVRLFGQMLSQRLYEIAQKPDAPFVGGGAGKSRFLGNMNVFALQGYAVKDNKMAECLDVLLTEYERVKKFGFTQTELDREKVNTLRNYEKYFNEKDKTESRNLTNEYLRNFLQDEIIPGVEYEYMFQKKFLPTIKLEEVNALALTLMTGKNRVILINMPEKENLKVPVAQDLQSVIDGVEKKELTAYVDKVSDKPLIEKEPAPMPLCKEKIYKDVGITEWTLSNGVKVVPNRPISNRTKFYLIQHARAVHPLLLIKILSRHRMPPILYPKAARVVTIILSFRNI